MTQDETEPGRTDERPDDRPLPGDGTYPAAQQDGDGDGDGARGDGDGPPPGPDAEPVYNDRDKLDFDPDDGLLSGTAIHGGTEIPGEHEMVDDVAIPEEGDADADTDGDDGSDDGSDDPA